VEDLLFPPAGWYGDGMSEVDELPTTDQVLRRAIAMNRAGYTLSEVSEATGMSRTSIQRAKDRARGKDDGSRDIDRLIAACPDVAGAIRSARVNKGQTQHQLAWAVGVHERTVSRWEYAVKPPHRTSVRKIAEALGLPFEELLSVKPSA
jgi:transcriptional regulator with XRE-family HTH domain